MCEARRLRPAEDPRLRRGCVGAAASLLEVPAHAEARQLVLYELRQRMTGLLEARDESRFATPCGRRALLAPLGRENSRLKSLKREQAYDPDHYEVLTAHDALADAHTSRNGGQAWAASGRTCKDYSARAGLNPRTLTWWKSKLKGTAAENGPTWFSLRPRRERTDAREDHGYQKSNR